MEKALAEARIDSPLVPVFANVTATAVGDVDTIRRLLVEQVTGMVRWRRSVLAMSDTGVERFIEFGGKVLAPMVKRIVRGCGCVERDLDGRHRGAGEGAVA